MLYLLTTTNTTKERKKNIVINIPFKQYITRHIYLLARKRERRQKEEYVFYVCVILWSACRYVFIGRCTLISSAEHTNSIYGFLLRHHKLQIYISILFESLSDNGATHIGQYIVYLLIIIKSCVHHYTMCTHFETHWGAYSDSKCNYSHCWCVGINRDFSKLFLDWHKWDFLCWRIIIYSLVNPFVFHCFCEKKLLWLCLITY